MNPADVNAVIQKVRFEWKPGELPACFVPVQFGSFFVAFSKG